MIIWVFELSWLNKVPLFSVLPLKCAVIITNSLIKKTQQLQSMGIKKYLIVGHLEKSELTHV